MLQKVIKRDGRVVEPDATKIEQAIIKAFMEVDGKATEDASAISRVIAADIIKKGDSVLGVEQIQDSVENGLMDWGFHEVAKKYILYRNERTKERELNSEIFQRVYEKTNAWTVQNSNANVDEQSFGGRKQEASSVVQKTIALNRILSPQVAKAHEDGYIYEHDLDSTAVGMSNCLFLDFGKIFTDGFTTRNGDVRPPSNFATACQLVAVAMQCQSQIQYGGVASMHLDTDLAPFVKMSFEKHFRDGLKWCEGYSDDEIGRWFKCNELSLSNNYHCPSMKAYNYARTMLEREGSQAAQGLYHNLNTLESRQGSQVKLVA